jgi:hypothetical protein
VKITEAKEAGGMAQVIEFLPSFSLFSFFGWGLNSGLHDHKVGIL